MKIVFCTTCKGRLQHIKKTLPQNLIDNPDATIVLLDYGSSDGLAAYIYNSLSKYIVSGQLVYYQFETDGAFQMAHAKNMAARCAMLEGADILVTLDADNFTGPGFCNFVSENISSGIFLCPDFETIKSLPPEETFHKQDGLVPGFHLRRGYAGRLVIRAQEFLKMGGYNERFTTWEGEDIDLIARMQRTGFGMKFISNKFLNAIPHGEHVRFKEYPHAKIYEKKSHWNVIFNRMDTVVNFGSLGCGTVYRNFSMHPIVLKSLPTRIFGIGLHKTATSSLHEAFKIIGYDSFHWAGNEAAFQIMDEMNQLGRSAVLERSYALCDLPIPMLYKKLDTAYPGSKFILTIRSESDWLKSVQGLFDPNINPFYDWDHQPYTHRIHESLYGQRYFDAEIFLARYRRHNAEVIEYFKHRPDDLLIMNMEINDHWSRLCKFLGTSVPQVGYPAKHKTR